MKYLNCLVFILFTFNCYSQSNAIKLEASDVFLVNITVDSIIPKWKFNALNQKNKICRITVNKVYYMADTVYMTYTQLERAKYMLFRDESITQGKSYNVSLAASHVIGVFIMGKFLKDDEINADKYNSHVSFVSYGIKHKKIVRFLRSQNQD